jgi:outer membrane protein assembly factor BamB
MRPLQTTHNWWCRTLPEQKRAESMQTRGVLWLRAAALILSVGLSGCSTISGWFAPDEDEANEPAELVDFEEQVGIKTLWSTGVGNGQGKTFNHLQMVIVGDTLFAVGSDGVIAALDKSNGKRRWRDDLDVAVTGGVGHADGLLFVGTADGDVIALSAADGSERWRTNVAGEVLAAPQGNGRVVVVQTYDGKLHGRSAEDGSALWVYDSNLPVLTLRGTSTPVIAERAVLAAFANGKLMSFDLETGSLRWEARVAIAQGRSEIDRIVDIDGTLLVAGSLVYAASYRERVAGVDIATGRKVWQAEASSYVGLEQGFGNIYVSDISGTVLAFQRSGRGERWSQPALENRRLSAPKTVRGYVAVGDLQGYVHFMSQVDGTFVGRTRVDSSGVRANMLEDDNILYILGNSGKVVALQVTARDA